jgi:hypothetical protein
LHKTKANISSDFSHGVRSQTDEISVERRTANAFASNRPVRLIDLDECENPVFGTLGESWEKGLTVLLERPIRVSTAIRADVGETPWLGEVCYCAPCEDGFHVALRARPIGQAA